MHFADYLLSLKLRDYVAKTLREAIVDGRVKPGERLDEDRLRIGHRHADVNQQTAADAFVDQAVGIGKLRPIVDADRLARVSGGHSARRATVVRYRQYRHQRFLALQEAVRQEIRAIVRSLHEQRVFPSVRRVRRLLKSGSLLNWKVLGEAVDDARKALDTN